MDICWDALKDLRYLNGKWYKDKNFYIESECAYCGKTFLRLYNAKNYCCVAHSKLGKKLSPEHIKKLSESHKGLPNNFKGKKHSKETRLKISESRKGQLKGTSNPNYRHGKSEDYRKYTCTMEHKEWRKQVFERDDYTCQLCDKRGVVIHPHHIFKKTEYVSLRSILWNGITLCKKCHYMVTGNESDYIGQFISITSNK